MLWVKLEILNQLSILPDAHLYMRNLWPKNREEPSANRRHCTRCVVCLPCIRRTPSIFQAKFDDRTACICHHQTEMTCYNIFVGYPTDENARINLMNSHRFQQLIRIHRAVFVNEEKQEPYVLKEIALCDEDAAALIRDLPEPFFIAAVVVRMTKTLFYISPLLMTSKRPVPPRYGSVEKEIYWWAASCEKRVARGSPRIRL